MDYNLYVVNVEGAIYKGDKWLIIKRSEEEEHGPGLMTLVGGKVEINGVQDGVLEDTLRREIREEVGIEVAEDMHYLESKTFSMGNGQLVVDVVFVCKYEAGEARPVDRHEVGEVYWMACKEVLESKQAPIWLKESIKKAEGVRLKVGWV
ncbi:MAG: NUDIX domain-containing protein [Tissierellia bacterium]|nr:NUDIX domain-containing protein [Tissierellia bacterium]